MTHVVPRRSPARRLVRTGVPALLFSLLGLGCESEDPVAPPQQSERIAIVNPPVFLNEGTQHQLQAVVLDASGAVDTMAAVTWESNRTDLAVFDAFGVLTVLAAAPQDGSVNATLLDPTIVRIAARSGSEVTERDIELRGWRYTPPAPGLGYHSPIAIRASEQRFTGSFDGVTLDADGEPLGLRLVCPTNQPSPTVTVVLEAPAAMLDPASLVLSLDDPAGSIFGTWTPDASTPAAASFTLSAIDATRFATALAAADTATAQVALASDPAAPLSVQFVVTGFDRFWTPSGALLGSCA